MRGHPGVGSSPRARAWVRVCLVIHRVEAATRCADWSPREGRAGSTVKPVRGGPRFDRTAPCLWANPHAAPAPPSPFRLGRFTPTQPPDGGDCHDSPAHQRSKVSPTAPPLIAAFALGSSSACRSTEASLLPELSNAPAVRVGPGRPLRPSARSHAPAARRVHHPEVALPPRPRRACISNRLPHTGACS